MKITITGANGYIGSRLCSFLSRKGHQIIAVSSSKIPKKPDWSEYIYMFIVGDIRKETTINKIASINSDVIIHLVSLNQKDSEKSPNIVSKVNVQPTWDLLFKCSKRPLLKKFIYLSTIHVYGRDKEIIVQDDRKPIPVSTYGLTHLISEEICNFYNRTTNVKCINIRLSNSYGEPIFFNSKGWSLVINDLIRSAFFDKKIVLMGDGLEKRDFIHYSDYCNGIEKIICSNDSFEEQNTFDFDSSKSISLIAVAEIIRHVYYKRNNIKIPIFINQNDLWEGCIVNENFIDNETTISSNKSESKFIKINKNLMSGIIEVFQYLEKMNNFSLGY